MTTGSLYGPSITCALTKISPFCEWYDDGDGDDDDDDDDGSGGGGGGGDDDDGGDGSSGGDGEVSLMMIEHNS